MSTYLILSSLLNLLAAALLTIFTLTSAGNREIRNPLVAFLVSIVLWKVGYVLWQLAPNADWALIHSRLLMIGAVWIPVSFFHLSCALAERSWPLVTRIGIACAVLFVVLMPTDLVVAGVSPKLEYTYWPDAGPFLLPLLGYFGAYVILSLMVLFLRARQSLTIGSTR